MQNYELLSTSSVSSRSASSQPGSSPSSVEHRFGRASELTTWILWLGLAVMGGVVGWWLAPWITQWMTRWMIQGDGLTLAIPTGEKAAWYMTRSTATVAYVLLTGAVVWGLLLSTKLVKTYVPAPMSLALHSALSWLGVALGGLHALLLLLDSYYTYTIGNLLIPFTGPYRPVWVGLGTIALYGLALVSASFWLRQWLGYRTWRMLHYLSFPLFVLVTLHGLFAGTDSTSLAMQMMYLFSGLLVLLLTLFRIVQAAATAKAKSSTVSNQRATSVPHTNSEPRTRVLASE